MGLVAWAVPYSLDVGQQVRFQDPPRATTGREVLTTMIGESTSDHSPSRLTTVPDATDTGVEPHSKGSKLGSVQDHS